MSKIRVGLIEKKRKSTHGYFIVFLAAHFFLVERRQSKNFSLPKGGLLQALEQRRSVDFSDKFNFPLQETFHTFCTSGALCFLRNLIFHGALDVRFLPIYAINYGNFDNALSPNLNLRLLQARKSGKGMRRIWARFIIKNYSIVPGQTLPQF